MKRYLRLVIAFSLMLVSTIAFSHPGSGIVVDENGQVYFTDTGKGVWKVETNGKLTYLPSSRFHWLTIDASGSFAKSPKSFGEYFERVIPEGGKPNLIQCSDFPLVIGKDGNIYYANTRPGASKIVRRMPDGRETVLVSARIFQFVSEIALGPDGSLYITEASNSNANTIRRITMNGGVSVIATYVGKKSRDLPLETTASYCRGLAVDAAGTIYVAATGSRSVLKITPQGKITTILQTASPWTPTGVAFFKGEVYVLEWHDVPEDKLEERTAWIPRIRKIGRDGKPTTLAIISR
jgi:sugar lactone lactonase YvrE